MARAAEAPGFFEQLVAFEVKPVNTRLVWPIAFATAWFFDLLFWGKAPGISFPVFVIVLLAGLYTLAMSASTAISGAAKWLMVPIAFFIAGPAIRAEPLTMFLDYLVTLLLLGLLADCLTGGGWIRYRLTDFIVGFIHLGLAGLVRGGIDLAERRAGRAGETSTGARYRPVIRGVLFSVPVLILFGLLLAAADPIFSRFVSKPFESIDGALAAEYAFRALYISILAYALAGFLLHALRPSRQTDTQPSKEIAIRVLGLVEGSVVLGTLTVLFAGFVVIQFRYFFAGSRAITNLGMTYSEYARRGFSELVVVALLTLGLLLGLSLIVRRDSRRERIVFSTLSSALVALTAVILTSSFQRLLLYEDAYGFTRLRAYSHVFMVWLALTLVVAVILQWRNSIRSMALVLVLAGLGLVASLNVLGVDSFIARSNIRRAAEGAELDVWYLDSLSTDAVPALVDGVNDLTGEKRSLLSNVLVCKAIAIDGGSLHWQSFHLSRERAESTLGDYQSRLIKPGEPVTCSTEKILPPRRRGL